MEETIIEYYKDPKTGLSINNTYRNLKKAGHKVTLKQVTETIQKEEKYTEVRPYHEQKNMFLKTVTGGMGDYQADIFYIKQHSKSVIKFVAIINIETRRGYVYHVPNIRKETVLEIFRRFINDVPEEQRPRSITTDFGSEFNNKALYELFEKHNIKLFYVNKTQFKTSFATAIVDRFIRTIKEKLETYQKINESKSIISAISEIVEGYNNTRHRTIGKSPNEMTKEDVERLAQDKYYHNTGIMNKFKDKIKDETKVIVLEKKNILDKGAKYKPSKPYKIVGEKGYNIELENGKSYSPKDLVVVR